jgi:hypothetical protein
MSVLVTPGPDASELVLFVTVLHPANSKATPTPAATTILILLMYSSFPRTNGIDAGGALR